MTPLEGFRGEMTRTAPALRHRAFEDLGVLHPLPTEHGHDVRQLDGVPVPHWRDDVFAVPAGAARLASTPHCPNQAFTAGPHVLAPRFHLETDHRALESWPIGHAEALVAAGASSR